MSPLLTRALGSRAAGRLACGLALACIAGCHHRPSAPAQRPGADTVHVGYGARSREQGGGAVQSATFGDSRDVRVTRVEELLVGRFPGVRVLRTPDGYSVRVRGTGSVLGSAEPLWVIDGMVVDVTPGRGLDWLDPADVERIDVLKDPAETSIYGVRGANGVILVRTKRPR
jgi:TonB-dependent SusC/RagA subfamily outer membrane receptor